MQLVIGVLFSLLNVLLVSAKTVNEQNVCGVDQVYKQNGDLNVGLIVNDCSGISPISWTYINSALWTINRLNAINFTTPLDLGLTVFRTCTEDDKYNVIYNIFKERNKHYYLDTYVNQRLDSSLNRFSNVLNVHLLSFNTRQNWIIEATVKLLLALDFRSNITVYTEDERTLQEFYSFTRTENICIKNGIIFPAKPETGYSKFREDVAVIFAKCEIIQQFLSNLTQDEVNGVQMIFAPADASMNIDVPEGSYVIEPLLYENALVNTRFTPSPLFFDIANSILDSTFRSVEFIADYCNESSSKIDCLKNNHNSYLDSFVNISPQKTINTLNLEDFSDAFVYNIFRVENLTMQVFNASSPSETTKRGILQSFVNVFTYHIFNTSLSGLELNLSSLEKNVLCPKCRLHCSNFIPKPPPKTILISYAFSKFGLRAESWVFGFLAVSLLGVIFCLAVFIFILVRFCKRDILEGNPFLTILLLFTVILMYCSVVPFALDSDKEVRNYICIARALSSTLTYALAFSLLLSRSILLATISKEVGFMAHVPGPVQSFLTLFIFGIQGALTLQFIGHCEDIFRGISFVYIMSYNVILLILLLFICPLNTRSQRNYREGKYFTIAIALIACVWSCWISGYAVFNNEWKDPMICLGLVSTASILLGTIFIPRTYMMTVSATRDRLTSALPSLQANSSIVDVYRASAQPIYDCINIAAINSRCGPPLPPPLPQNEVYSNPTMPCAEEYDFERSVTPNGDKVTRF